MFGAILQLQRMEDDTARRINSLRIAYRRLESLDRNHPLLLLIELKDDTTKQSPYPQICPVNVVYKFTRDFVSKYKEYQQLETSNILMDYPKGLERYVVDLEFEAERIQQSVGKMKIVHNICD